MANDIYSRFVRDKVPVRMGNMASNMGRIQAIGEMEGEVTTARTMIDETIMFIELTLPVTDFAKARLLTELKQILEQWRISIDEIWKDPTRHSLLCEQAGNWSDRLVEASGLLQSPSMNR